MDDPVLFFTVTILLPGKKNTKVKREYILGKLILFIFMTWTTYQLPK